MTFACDQTRHTDSQNQPASDGNGKCHCHTGYGSSRHQQHIREIEDDARAERENPESFLRVQHVVDKRKTIESQTSESECINNRSEACANRKVEIVKFE